MKILSLLNKLKKVEFEDIPNVHKDFEIVNRNKQNKKTYISIVAGATNVFKITNELVAKLNLPNSGFNFAVRGSRNIGYTFNRILKDNPLKKYNLIPTLSVLPLFYEEEDRMITIFNEGFKFFLNNNKEREVKIRIKVPAKDCANRIILLADSFTRISILEIGPFIANMISQLFNISPNLDNILEALDDIGLYIINVPALKTLDLVYIPSEQLEYHNESAYRLVNAKTLFLLSAGLENPEVTEFVKSVLMIRHMIKREDQPKYTVIETPMSTAEFEQIYKIKRENMVVI